MLRVAYQRGANAVVGMRFDHRPISESWNEVCAYGTAVFVIPAPRHSPDQIRVRRPEMRCHEPEDAGRPHEKGPRGPEHPRLGLGALGPRTAD